MESWIVSFGNFRIFHYWFKMNQETNNRFEQTLKDISKPEQHIREHVIIVSASRFPRLKHDEGSFVGGKNQNCNDDRCNLTRVRSWKIVAKKWTADGERRCRQADLITQGFAILREAANSRRGNSFRIYQRRNETRNFESSVDGISTINYSWMRHTKGSSKRYPNDKDYQRLFVVCTLAVGNRFPVAGFYENEDK